MKVEFIKNEKELVVNIDGRLDTVTAPDFEKNINENLKGVSSLVLNCEGLTYISSAGLRVVLALSKKMKNAMKLTNVCEIVMEVFDMTGFTDILIIE